MNNTTNFSKTFEKRQELLAFVSDSSTESVLKSLATTMGLPSSCVVQGDIKAATKYLQESRSPQILVVDLSDSELPISDINELAEVCEPGVLVIALGMRNDVGLFRELLASGITDYLVKPISVDLLRRTISIAQGTAEQENRGSGLKTGRLVTVLGVRGGMGATTIAINCAWILANERAKRIALIDLDVHFGNAFMHLDLKPSSGFAGALQTPDRIDSTFLERIMVKHSDRLVILSAEEELSKLVDFNEQSMEKLLPILRNQFHYVFADIYRPFTPASLYLLNKSSTILLVCDMSLASIRDLNRILNYLGNDSPLGRRIIIIVNRTNLHKNGEVNRTDFEKAIPHPINHYINFDPHYLLQSSNMGQPVVRSSSSVTHHLRRIVDDLSGNLQPESDHKIWEKFKIFNRIFSFR